MRTLECHIITYAASSKSRSGNWRKMVRISSASENDNFMSFLFFKNAVYISDRCIRRPLHQTLGKLPWSRCQGPSLSFFWEQPRRNQPNIRSNNLYMRTQNSSHSTASLPSTSTWSHNDFSADITHLKPHLINRVLQLGLGGVLSQRSHHLGELLTNVTNVHITSLSLSLTFVLMLPSPFLSNSLKADLNTLFSSSVMLARMARLSSSVTAWIRPLLIMSVSRGIQWCMYRCTCHCYGKEF